MLDFSRIDKNGIKNVSFVFSQSVYVCFLFFLLEINGPALLKSAVYGITSKSDQI